RHPDAGGRADHPGHDGGRAHGRAGPDAVGGAPAEPGPAADAGRDPAAAPAAAPSPAASELTSARLLAAAVDDHRRRGHLTDCPVVYLDAEPGAGRDPQPALVEQE